MQAAYFMTFGGFFGLVSTQPIGTITRMPMKISHKVTSVTVMSSPNDVEIPT
jgi:hypothetical protein